METMVIQNVDSGAWIKGRGHDEKVRYSKRALKQRLRRNIGWDGAEATSKCKRCRAVGFLGRDRRRVTCTRALCGQVPGSTAGAGCECLMAINYLT